MSEPIIVWHDLRNETRLILESGADYYLQLETRLTSSWEATQCLSLTEEQAIALYGVLASLFAVPGPESAEDVPLPLQRLSTAALLIEAVEAGYWASALGGDIRGESTDRRLQQVAGEINRRLYQYLQPSPWLRIGETLYNVAQLRTVNRGTPDLFEYLNNQAQQQQEIQ